jgi:hypothetical protein
MKTNISRRTLLGGAIGSQLLLSRPNTASMDPDGMLRIDGKRTFVLGLYQTTKQPDGMRSAADAGFQLVHSPAEQAFLDKAHAHGLRCWVTTGSDPARIRNIVSTFSKHPALLFWETEDEPSYQWKKPAPRVSPERIRAAYALLKQLDPGRLVYLNHAPTNLVSTLQSYNPGGDILATDIYPVIPHGIRELYGLWPTGRQGDFADTHISQVGRYADKIREVAGPSRATFMVLQAFAWENLREKDRNPAMVLYPNRTELRFMAWQAIVHGANGILWWGLSHTPQESSFWTDLTAVVKEIGAHAEALSEVREKLPLSLTYHDTGHSLDRGVEWIAKPSGNGYLLILVNADPNPVDVSLQGPRGPLSGEGISGTNAVIETAGGLRIKLAPFDVRLVRIPKL